MNGFSDKSSDTRKVRLVRPAHVYYTHQNLDAAEKFLHDFGFQEARRVRDTVYYRGTGPDAFVLCAKKGSVDEFGGAAFVVESMEDLELASKTLHKATEIYHLDDAPGGGHCVTFKDPVDDFPFHLVYGQTLDDTTAFPHLDYNFVSCLCGSTFDPLLTFHEADRETQARQLHTEIYKEWVSP